MVSLDALSTPLAYQTIEDYLRTDSSVDIQQRGSGGIMADISVRGASFEQTLVLVNGMRVDNAETAHFNLDLPIPFLTIGRFNILHGEGSTLYGSDAIGGVVDVRTGTPTQTSLRLRAGTGSFGENEQAFIGSLSRKNWNNVLAGDRGFSSGFIEDRDYRSENGSDELRLHSCLGDSDLLFAGDDRSYGANQFYGPYMSWERTKGWFSALTQQLTPSTQASVAYRRHSDIYLLERNEPDGYKNQHIDDGFEGALRDHRDLARNLTLATGLEEVTDHIDSTNLGRHGRNRGAGYAALEWLGPTLGSLSLGAREDVFDAGPSVFSPMLSATRWLSRSVTVHGSIGHGFRIPTYLDLYYSDPTTIGNPALKPESAWNFEGGMNWFPKSSVAMTFTAFYSRQHDTIDYTRAFEGDPWKASNLPGLRFTGVETSLNWQAKGTEYFNLSWTLLAGAQNALRGLQSEYVFNYPVNNARVTWTQQLSRQIALNTRLGILQRFNQDPYAVWNASFTRQTGKFRPYLQITNLANTAYDEIVDVRLPGRGFVGGVEIVFPRQSR